MLWRGFSIYYGLETCGPCRTGTVVARVERQQNPERHCRIDPGVPDFRFAQSGLRPCERAGQGAAQPGRKTMTILSGRTLLAGAASASVLPSFALWSAQF